MYKLMSQWDTGAVNQDDSQWKQKQTEKLIVKIKQKVKLTEIEKVHQDKNKEDSRLKSSS